MSDTPTLQHRLTCVSPDVHMQRGVTRLYLHCRSCGAEAWVDLADGGAS